MFAMDPPPPTPKAKSFRYDRSVFSSPLFEHYPLYRSFSHNHSSSFELDISFSSYVSSYAKQKDQNIDTEITIFDAHKYFTNTKSHPNISPPPPSPAHDQTLHRLSSVSSQSYSRNPRTPIASPEPSWNTQTVNPPVGVSLKNLPPRSINSNHRSKKTSKNGIFGRNKSSCCCAGTSSVRVNEAIKNKANAIPSASIPQKSSVGIAQVHPQKKNPSLEEREFPALPDEPTSGSSFDGARGFSFPVLKPGPKRMVLVEDSPQDSPLVFRPNNQMTARTLHFNPGSPLGRMETTDDELGSDASSDLFEIESFSTQSQTTIYQMFEIENFSASASGSCNRRRGAAGRRRITKGAVDEFSL